MPTYLCHGFRWQRRSVRVYVILQNIDDASPEWIIPAKSSQSILKSFYDVFEFLPYCSPGRGRYTPTREADSDDDNDTHVPNYTYASKDRSLSRGRGRSQSQATNQSRSQSRAKQQQPLPPLPAAADDDSSTASEDDFSAQSWSAIKLLEEYDPRDLTAVSRPYAYVADYAVRIDLSCSIVDEIARYEQQQLQSPHPSISIPSRKDLPEGRSGWFEDLRDQLQSGEEIRWYVVVNNDEVRDCVEEPEERTSTPRQEPRYQYSQYQPYQQQQQQSYQYQYQYQTQPGRPLPSREQRQHHAQYMHQQRIFEKEGRAQTTELEQETQFTMEEVDRGRKPDQQLQLKQQQQQQQQQQQLISEKSNQGKKREQDQQQKERQQQQQQILEWNDRERKKEQERQKEREKEREKERQRQQEKERQQKEMERQQRQQQQREQEQRQRRQQDQKTPSYTTAPNGNPPTVPEKDIFHFPRPPTANANANTKMAPLRSKPSFDAGAPPRSKISFDAGPAGRPKTPAGKGGALRRLFGRSKVDVGHST